jgi:RNA polymerase sigma-54 factor
MALTPKIEIRQSQRLFITPQMQQSIGLLQMSGLELAEFVANELERNPFLESSPTGSDRSRASERFSGASSLSDELDRLPEKPTLGSHLRRQVGPLRLEPDVREAAFAIIDELDEDGYFRSSLPEFAALNRFATVTVERALEVVQSCDPAGIAARDLRECLALQFRDRGRSDPAAMGLIENLELVALGKLSELRQKCGLSAVELDQLLRELRALDPKPGRRFEDDAEVPTVIPDVYVTQTGGGDLKVQINSDTLPRIFVNREFSASIKTRDEKTIRFVAENLERANWLVRSLERRVQTILRVASAIVVQQRDFLMSGPAHMRPMTRRGLAASLDLHESTVGRVASNKYLACARGCYRFGDFFGSQLPGAEGEGTVSSIAVQDRIRRLIREESGNRTLSDDRIAELLCTEGIHVARRTVAKYRELMGIPSSVDRRRMIPASPRAGRISGAATWPDLG